jgi:choline dehydrogenase-like flavoprotein
MLAFAEMEVSRHNRISIDPARKDAWGIPAARVECAHSKKDGLQILAMNQVMSELAAAARLKAEDPFQEHPIKRMVFSALRSVVLSPTGAFWPGASIHETGGAAMGEDPGSSVLNKYNQCWEAPNILVCDGASFPRAGFQYPTLTIMAQTARACEHLVASRRETRSPAPAHAAF